MAEVVREMLIARDPLETRVAIVEDSQLVELYIERSDPSIVGNIYLGSVCDVLPGMQAAFIDIGVEKNVFLYIGDVVFKGSSECPNEGRSGARSGANTPNEGRSGEGHPRRGIATLLKPGQRIMVQVLKDPMGTKGGRVTMALTLPGRLLVLMPFSASIGISRKLPAEERERLHSAIEAHVPEGIGVIVRTAAHGASKSELVADLGILLGEWGCIKSAAEKTTTPALIHVEAGLVPRFVRDVFSAGFCGLVVDGKEMYEEVSALLSHIAPKLRKRLSLHRGKTSLFESRGIEKAFDDALAQTVVLPSGGHIVIGRTEALTAIDVNTGRYVGGSSFEDTILQTNLEAADEIARQLRLRDIGGIIVVDFIDMEQCESGQQLHAALSTALARDRTRTRVSEISRLGLIEITRKNVSDGLYDTCTEPCRSCGGQGRVLSAQTRRIVAERRMREALKSKKGSAYHFGLDPETHALFSAAENHAVEIGAAKASAAEGHAAEIGIAQVLSEETGCRVEIVAEEGLAPTEVSVRVEGKQGLFTRGRLGRHIRHRGG
ncbi:MAG: Rne/Rng family ribonuclease [Coriobacteriia bacterium]|nr:Rne/Rng family ribonuclease [Coriobacteriia bacterium]